MKVDKQLQDACKNKLMEIRILFSQVEADIINNRYLDRINKQLSLIKELILDRVNGDDR